MKELKDMIPWVKQSWSSFKKAASSSFTRTNRDDDDDDDTGDDDALIWSRGLDRNSHGEFSFAVVQGNSVLEDESQVETGTHATFIGIYDGHGGTDASRYIREHLFNNFLRHAREKGTLTEGTLTAAFSETEDGFLGVVEQSFAMRQLIAATGSCCLVGVIWKGMLYVANLGDSRAVMGYLNIWNKIVPKQLTRDHNATMKDVREELRKSHSDDPTIVVKRQGVWRVKGIIQVSRSIGDAYLKKPEFAFDSSNPRFHLDKPLTRPVLRSDPAIVVRELKPKEKFIIFASDGLWDCLTNKEAVDIVNNNPRRGIAKKLLVCAMKKAARRSNKSYSEIKTLGNGARRDIHDDISVVVTFLDRETTDDKSSAVPSISVRGFVGNFGPSNFDFTRGFM